MRLGRKDVRGGSGGSYKMVLVFLVMGVFNWSLFEDTKSDCQHRGSIA